MKIPVTTNIEKFYSQLIKLMSSFAPLNKVRPRDLEILSELLYQNYQHRNSDEDTRNIIIFSTKNRRKMEQKLGMTQATFDVYISNLKKKGIISKDNKLPKFLSRIIPGDEFEFSVLFKMSK